MKTPDFFEHEDGGGKDKLAHDVEILMMEWAFFYPNHSVTSYIQDIKGYSPTQMKDLSRLVPFEQWGDRRKEAQDKLTETLVRRHIDLMASVQDQHISASKLGLAQAVKMLAGGSTEILRDKEGKAIVDSAGNPRFKSLRSIDLLNCMSSIEKAQQIYRRAMGLPNDEGGLQQILNKLERIRETPTTTLNLTQNIQQNNTAVQIQNPTDLSYDDIMLLIEAERTKKAKQVSEEDKMLPAAREGVPTGDFTANNKQKPN